MRSLRSRQDVLLLVALFVLWFAGGCSKRDEMIELAIPAPAVVESVVGEAKEGVNLSIGVRRFDDRRRESSLLGVRTGRFGALDSYTFVVSGADLGQAVTEALVGYLGKRGMTARTIRIGAGEEADVLISGEIVELVVDARANWFSTRVSGKATLLIEAENRSDGTRVSQTVSGTDSRNVAWFDPHHAEALINQVLIECYAKWRAGIKIDGRMVRSKDRS